MQLKRIIKSKFFVGIPDKQRKYIIHPEFMVENQEITDQFIQNLKSNPNKVTFDILNKLICNYMVGNHKFRMNDKISLFDCNTNKEPAFLCSP